MQSCKWFPPRCPEFCPRTCLGNLDSERVADGLVAGDATIIEVKRSIAIPLRVPEVPILVEAFLPRLPLMFGGYPVPVFALVAFFEGVKIARCRHREDFGATLTQSFRVVTPFDVLARPQAAVISVVPLLGAGVGGLAASYLRREIMRRLESRHRGQGNVFGDVPDMVNNPKGRVRVAVLSV